MNTFRKIIGFSNIVFGIGLLILLHFVNVSDRFSSIMLMSLFVGWIFPFIGLVVSGLGILIHSNFKITLIFNIVNILVILFMGFLVIKVYDSKLLIVLIEYIVMLVINILNIVYLIINKDVSKIIVIIYYAPYTR